MAELFYFCPTLKLKLTTPLTTDLISTFERSRGNGYLSMVSEALGTLKIVAPTHTIENQKKTITQILWIMKSPSFTMNARQRVIMVIIIKADDGFTNFPVNYNSSTYNHSQSWYATGSITSSSYSNNALFASPVSSYSSQTSLEHSDFIDDRI